MEGEKRIRYIRLEQKQKKKKQAISNTDSALNNREGATTAPSPDGLNKLHFTADN